jgi:hypothetical protein
MKVGLNPLVKPLSSTPTLNKEGMLNHMKYILCLLMILVYNIYTNDELITRRVYASKSVRKKWAS